MIQNFKSEFKRCADFVGADFVSQKNSEFEDFAQNFTFSSPVINFEPIMDYESNIGHSGQVMYNGRCKLFFVTKIEKSDNFETKKDELLDGLILIAEHFYRKLDRNENRVFISPRWEWSNRILRQYTSNYLVAIEATIKFNTACNRVEKIGLDLSENNYIVSDYVDNYFL